MSDKTEKELAEAFENMLTQTGNDSEATPLAARTLLDDLIDNGVPDSPTPARVTCPQCNGTDFTSRGGLSRSERINVCTNCNFKVITRKRAHVPTVETHAQGRSGPFYRGRMPKPPDTRHFPIHRIKGKGKGRKK